MGEKEGRRGWTRLFPPILWPVIASFERESTRPREKLVSTERERNEWKKLVCIHDKVSNGNRGRPLRDKSKTAEESNVSSFALFPASNRRIENCAEIPRVFNRRCGGGGRLSNHQRNSILRPSIFIMDRCFIIYRGRIILEVILVFKKELCFVVVYFFK